MCTLFVVDDDEISQYLLKRNIVQYPVFEYVLYYDGGMQVIKYIKQHMQDSKNLPDAILLDLRMPVFSGWDVLDALQAIYPMLSKKIMVYIITSSVMPTDIIKAKGYSFVREFFSKPITEDDFMSISNQVQSLSA
jgi:CheY-like chemotaxis protein